MKKTRLLSLLLALLLTATLFAGCGGSGTPSDTTAATGGETTAATSGTASGTSADTSATAAETTTEETVKTYGGYEFTISRGTVFPQLNEDGSYKDALSEELGDRLEALQAKLDCTFTKVDVSDTLTTVITASMSGVKVADLVYCETDQYWPMANANALLPLDGDELTSLGLNYADETRFYQPAVLQTKMFDHYWGLQVASKYSMETGGFFLCFNHELVSGAGDYDLYQLVRDKQWTWELYRTIAKVTTKDIDGDGTNDIWGTGATGWGHEIVSKDLQYVGQNADGKWVFTMGSAEGIKALDVLKGFNETDGTRWDVGSGDCRKAFANGTITFCFATPDHINGPGSALYDSNHDYGVVPAPLCEGVTEYSCCEAGNGCYVISTGNNKDLDKLVPILNEWALILNDTENWKDRFSDGRCRTDADLEMMIDYIIPNYTADIGCISSEIWDAIDEGLISAICYDGLTVQQAVERQTPVINALLDDFFKQ